MNIADLISKSPYPNYINGKEHTGRSGKTFESTNPADGTHLAEIHEADLHDADLAVQAAYDCFHSKWKHTTPKERAVLLNKLAAKLDQQVETLSWLECYDVGKPIGASRTWLKGAPATLEYYAALALGLSGETLNISDKSLMDITVREPLGVCALIVPWNFPLSIALLKMAPALAAGNTVVIKPSEVTPLSTCHLARIVDECGFPPGAINIINGPGSTVGDYLVRDGRVAKVSFTGGSATGQRIYAAAAGSIKKLTLELGGKSATVVMADADIGLAVQAAYGDMVRNTGQVCGACLRLVLHEEIADEFLQALGKKLSAVKVGLPWLEDTEMGPVVSRTQFDRIHDYFAVGQAEGASPQSFMDVGERNDLRQGHYIAPTLFMKATPSMRTSQEEIFGPVGSVLRFRETDEAMRIANATPYGLATVVFTTDVRTAMNSIRQLDCGTVCVNTGNRSSLDAPFGGFKLSGMGKERGREALLDDTRIKNVRLSL